MYATQPSFFRAIVSMLWKRSWSCHLAWKAFNLPTTLCDNYFWRIIFDTTNCVMVGHSKEGGDDHQETRRDFHEGAEQGQQDVWGLGQKIGLLARELVESPKSSVSYFFFVSVSTRIRDGYLFWWRVLFAVYFHIRTQSLPIYQFSNPPIVSFLAPPSLNLVATCLASWCCQPLWSCFFVFFTWYSNVFARFGG